MTTKKADKAIQAPPSHKMVEEAPEDKAIQAPPSHEMVKEAPRLKRR